MRATHTGEGVNRVRLAVARAFRHHFFSRQYGVHMDRVSLDGGCNYYVLPVIKNIRLSTDLTVTQILLRGELRTHSVHGMRG